MPFKILDPIYETPEDISVYWKYVEADPSVVFYPGCRIGGTGFGYEREGNGYKSPPERRPHEYKVIIKKGVIIGENSIIHRGRWRNTWIDEYVQIDALVHIAHNVEIGRETFLVAGTVVGGSCQIGDNCFIGENVSIKQGVKIADHVTIGMGSVVRHDIEQPNSTWAGNPCVKIADVQKF